MTSAEEVVVARRPGQPVLAVRDLRVWYATERGPVRAVDGVSFSLAPGETLGLVGESGCGKSSLGRGVLGLLPRGAVTDGEVLFEGEDLLQVSRARLEQLRGAGLGLVFQEPMTRLDPLLRVSEHFEEVLRVHEPDLDAHQRRERAQEALRSVGIPPSRYTAYPHEFSGGMRQRIMIALVLVDRPALVVADEPTTALDVLVEAQVVRIFGELRRRHDTAMLFITHNLGIVAQACDRVAVMYAGRIVEQGPVSDVFGNPQHPYTRELLASTISLGTSGLHFLPGSPPDLSDPPPGCRFHPRCPVAMRVCADRFPEPVLLGAGSVECWQHGPAGLVPPGGRDPLQRAEVERADEA